MHTHAHPCTPVASSAPNLSTRTQIYSKIFPLHPVRVHHTRDCPIFSSHLGFMCMRTHIEKYPRTHTHTHTSAVAWVDMPYLEESEGGTKKKGGEKKKKNRASMPAMHALGETHQREVCSRRTAFDYTGCGLTFWKMFKRPLCVFGWKGYFVRNTRKNKQFSPLQWTQLLIRFLFGKFSNVCCMSLGGGGILSETLEKQTFQSTSMSSVANLWFAFR